MPNQAARLALTSTPGPETPHKQAMPASALHSHPPLASPRIMDNSIDVSVPLAPPLPLILRPPLRKKKSFSRVSDWLFPADMDKNTTNHPPTTGGGSCGGGGSGTARLASFAAHKRGLSIDSVTNAPRALTDRDGFYQTLPPSALFSGPRRSLDSSSPVSRPASTTSVYSTDEEQTGYGPGTVATSSQWSPGSTPPEEVRLQADSWRKTAAGLQAFAGPERVATFGSRASEHDRKSAQVQKEVPIRRVPLYVRQASLATPRPTSVGVAF